MSSNTGKKGKKSLEKQDLHQKNHKFNFLCRQNRENVV